jgi:hypothetical protein
MRTATDFLSGIHRSIATDKVALSSSMQYLTIAHNAVTKLTVPEGATYALLVFECVDTTAFTDVSKVARVAFDNTTPVIGTTPPNASATSRGIPVGHLDTFDISEKENLDLFSCIKSENAGVLYLHVYYYR